MPSLLALTGIVVGATAVSIPVAMYGVSFISGWRTLVRAFPAQLPLSEQASGRWASLQIGAIGAYNRCFRWTVDEAHLHLTMHWPWFTGAGHAPISIPRSVLEPVGEAAALNFWRGTRYEVAGLELLLPEKITREL